MGPIFVIIFWLFLASVYGIVFLAFAGLCILSWKKHWTWLKWITGIPAAFMVLLAIFVMALFTYGIIDSMNPRSVFKNTFGEPPSSEVNDIHSNVWFFADSGSIYLTFKTSRSEFLRLVPPGLTKQTLEDIKKTAFEISSEDPSWWTFRYKSDWTYYLHSGYGLGYRGKHGFASETEYYAYDPNTSTAYYRFIGID
jgi:hypothetical protein